MKISKIKIRNYRLLREIVFNLEDELSLVIGKNNCGKTSFLAILDKFLGKKSDNINPKDFSYDDFNIEFQKELEQSIEKHGESLQFPMGITMKIFIEYTDSDNLSNISKLMMDLDPDNRTIVLLFEYVITQEKYNDLKINYLRYKESLHTEIQNDEEPARNDHVIFDKFIKKHYRDYFLIYRKSVLYDRELGHEIEDEYIDIKESKISLSPILNFNVITANRDISNKDSDKTLSFQASKYYDKKEDVEKNSPQIEKFKEILERTDGHLDSVYKEIFKTIIEKVKLFGGIKEGDSIISIISTLQHRELLKGNTTVMYDCNGEGSLPENYNGLGYLNLISIIFDIELLINDFRRIGNINQNPADINLLFIEEPEAHTHPQMQYVFINNIKTILKHASQGIDGLPFNLQTIITSHSSHIVAECCFDDIKYFYKEVQGKSVVAKNLKDIALAYEDSGEIQNYKFLKQYLTLNRAELFFADKAIFIEGDTERILLPAMMKKIDQDDGDINTLPLSSQNISIVEVGAYSHVFEKFFDFIGLKSLIITDIDSVDNNRIACRVKDSKKTSNTSLKYFYKAELSGIINNEYLPYFIDLQFQKKLLKKNRESKDWKISEDGNLAIVYQTEEKGYNARSFEDAFFHLNREFIKENRLMFKSLKNIDFFDKDDMDAFSLAENCIDKKPSFALEILLNSVTGEDGKKYSNWQIPKYIEEGLIWLKKN